MSTQQYIATLRSKTTSKTDEVTIEVHPGQTPEETAANTAASYNAEVVSIIPANPIELLLATVRESIGLIEAWQCHLRDTGADKASKVVEGVLDRARNAYRLTKAMGGK